jgi:hypothetical protein
VLAYLVAAVAWRVAILLGRLLLEPRLPDDKHAPRYRLVPMPDEAATFWHMRLGLFAGWFAFGWATCEVLATLGFSQDAQRLVALTLGLELLALAIEALCADLAFISRCMRSLRGVANAKRSIGSSQHISS